ncbi:SspB-related isopeptide-forming adhesin [Streptococcus gallolyticus]|uniref:SspB-related isopeptide-forming adhesin n=1 Tax=Streptococcus gallolyticus TaxID=315405 RepID=UPI00201AC711|nr:SspB-related isopeptide-forming adhesin [Streptococcus gallolyticus]MCL4890053.1 LPXTG cell wall anchor domain-containing protein [Streptococcus gallolyticus]
MTNQNTQNGHGFFRKKKWAKGLASGIALGAVVTISGAAYADDATNTVETQPEVTVVSDSNATNLSEAQADNSQSHTDLTNQSGAQTGDLTNTVTSDSLNQSVSAAQKAGVDVTTGDTVTHDSLAEAQTDLNNQQVAVDQATETQKAVDEATAKATEAAQQSGVDVTTSNSKTYTSTEEATTDAKAQTDHLTEVTNAQKQVNEQLPKAIESATQSGVKVTVKAGTKTTDAKKALENLANQVANLKKAQDTQNTINNSMAQALEEAKKAGVTVSTTGLKSYDDLAQALADAQAQVTKLTEFKNTQTAANQSIQSAVTDATKAGVSITKGDTKTYTSAEEAKADSAKQVSSLTQATATQKEADKTIADLTKQAQEAGLDLTKGASKSYTSVEEAKQDLAKQEQALKDAQAAKTKAETTNSANKQAAEEAQAAANKAIDDAVAKATASGTTVTTAGTIETTVEEAQKIAQEQVAKVNEIAAKNEQIQEENAAKKSAYDSQKAAVDQKNKAAFDRVGLNYTGDYETDKATADKFNADEIERVKSQFEKANDGNVLGANDGWVQYVGSNGYTQSNTSQFKKAQTVNGVEIVATGSLEPGKTTVYVKGDVNQSHVIANINWGNVAPEGANLNSDIGTDWAGAYDYNTNGTTTQIWKGKVLQWYRIPQAITMLDGSVHDAYVLFHADTSGLTSPGDEVVFWNQDGAINAVDGYRTGVNDHSDGIRTVIRVDSPDNEDNYLWISLLGDFDIGQYLEAENDVVVLGIGGGFATNSGVGGNPVAVDENLGLTYGKNTTPTSALTGFNSAPDGVALIAQYSNQYSTIIRNTAGGNGVAVARTDFGAEAKVSIVTPRHVSISNVEEPTYTETLPVSVQTVHITADQVTVPTSVTLHDVNVQAETHDIKLETKVVPITVETEVTTPALSATVHDITLKTAVHSVEVTQKPTNEKAVTNNDNIDINGKTVAKGSTVKWVLKNSNLLAGREELTAVVMNDPFPAGFEVDNEATAKANADYYTLKTTEDGSYQLVGTAKLLSILNAHRDQDVEVPGFVFVGKPLNDNAHYDNAFETIYSTANGYYKVVSNIPSIDTPDNPNPTKTVTDKAGSDIDGKTVFDKEVTFHLITDYSVYVNTIVDVDTMAKSAGIYDDTDDKTVNPDITKATVTDSKGNDITAKGTFYDIEAGQPIPAEIQIFLDGAHLTPDGEFVVWIPNDLKDYYQNYVLTGNNVTVNLPVEIIAQPGETAENTFVQVEFGNGYQSNLVFVKVPDVSPEKHAISKDGTVLDGQEVGLNQVFNYKLDGVTVQKDHDTLWQYDGKDKLDLEHDRYTGNWKGVITGTEYTAKEDMTLPYDVITEDGTVLKAGDTITAGTSYHFIFEFNQDTDDDFINQIVKVTWDAEKGEWAYSIDKDFLNSLGVEGTFDADFWIEVERIKDGEVENTFINTINGRELVAKVTTHTPTPETPGEPEQPAKPVEEVPVVKAATLPMTGDETTPMSVLATLIGLMMTVGAVFGLRKKEKHH